MWTFASRGALLCDGRRVDVTRLAGIDMGSSHIRVVVGERAADGSITITGRGEAKTPPSAAYQGTVSNQEKYQESLRKVVEEVGVMAGFQIDHAYVGVSSLQMEGMSAEGKVHIQGKGKKVSPSDKERVLEHCTSIKLPETHEIFAVRPMEYQIDGQSGSVEPVNMVGHDLSVRAHLVTCPKGLPANITATCNGIGIKIIALVFEPLGAAEAVMSSDDREMGCLLVDIGFDTTHAMVVSRQSVLYDRVLPVGGRHFTTDLAQVLGISQKEAEAIKVQRASLAEGAFSEDDAVELRTVGQGRTKIVTFSTIAAILYDRAEELVSLIRRDIERQNLTTRIKAGCVLTGGGSRLDGLSEFVSRQIGCQTRIGVPVGFSGLTDMIAAPEWATAVGVMLYGQQYQASLWRRERGFWSAVTHMVKKVFVKED